MLSPVGGRALSSLMKLQYFLTEAECSAEDGTTRVVITAGGGKEFLRQDKARVRLVHFIGDDATG